MTLPEKIVFFANTDWYLYNFRRSLAERLRAEGCRVVMVSPDGEYARRLVAAGFTHHPIDEIAGNLNPLTQLSGMLRLAKILRHERPGLLHCFTLKCVLYGGLVANLVRDVAVVNAVTGLGHLFTTRSLRNGVLRAVLSLLVKRATRRRRTQNIFQNEEDRDFFLYRNWCRPESTVLIRGSGVDCQRFAPRVRIADPTNRSITVTFASRLLREKGIDDFILLADRFAQREDVRFIIAGEFSADNPTSLTRGEMQMLTATRSNIEFVGHVDDMPDFLSRSDIVVLPSYREGTPKVLLEAAAMELPLVAYDIAGCRGVVVDGVSGYLVPLKNTDKLFSAVKRLTENESLRQTMGAAGRENIQRYFADEQIIAATLSVYKNMTTKIAG